MKKKLLYMITVLGVSLASCTKNFTEINTNPGAFIAAEPEAVLPGVFYNTINRFEINNFRTLWEYSHLIEPTGRYLTGDENTWKELYVTVLGNTNQLKKLYYRTN